MVLAKHILHTNLKDAQMIFTKEQVTKKTIFAHLGAHKTATSLIQQYFKAKHKYYADQGVYFLNRSEISPFISWGDKIIENPTELANGLKKKTKKSNAPTIFFSNENVLGRPLQRTPGLYPSAKDIIPALGKALSAYDTKIIYSIRPQWEFLESYYLQKVHQGYFLTFNQFLESVDMDNLYWQPVIDALGAEFGQENVKIVDFSLIRKGQDTFISEFIKQNISEDLIPDLDYAKVHNASISDRGLQLALRINPLLKREETSSVRKFLQENFSNQTEPRPNLLSADMKAVLKDRYESDYNGLVTKT